MKFEKVDNIIEGLDLLKKGLNLIDTYQINKLKECYEFLFERYAPFKVGDRVQLAATPKIEEDSGWCGSEHFLVKGAKATVAEVDCYDKGWHFLLQFDDESFIPTWGDNKGVPQPIKDKHCYSFPESYVQAIEEEPVIQKGSFVIPKAFCAFAEWVSDNDIIQHKNGKWYSESKDCFCIFAESTEKLYEKYMAEKKV